MTSYHRSKRLLWALMTSLLLLLNAPAFAQDAAEARDGEERAAQFYQEASEAYGVGDYGRAAELLERAYAHEQNLVYKYNQILAVQGLGDYEGALRILDIYSEPMRLDGRFDDLDELKDELERALSARQESEVAQAAAPKEPPTVSEAPADRGSSTLLGWSLVGTGAAALATGALFGSGVLISDTTDRLESSRTAEDRAHIYGSGEFDRDDDLAALKTHQVLTVAFLAGGALAAGAGGLLLFLNSPGDKAPSEAVLELAPMVSPHVAGATLRGRF